MTNTHMKTKCSTFNHKDMQIRMALKFHLTAGRLTIIKKTNNKYWWGCTETEPSHTAGGNIN
jgi:hypothetical protein